MMGDDNQDDGDLGNRPWQLWVDGTALPNPGRISIGLVLTSPSGETTETGTVPGLYGCNNEAELQALIAGLALASSAGARRLQVYSDSDFVVRHVRGEMSTQVARLLPLIHLAQQGLARFEAWELGWIPRHRNSRADAQARGALGLAPAVAAKAKRRR